MQSDCSLRLSVLLTSQGTCDVRRLLSCQNKWTFIKDLLCGYIYITRDQCSPLGPDRQSATDVQTKPTEKTAACCWIESGDSQLQGHNVLVSSGESISHGKYFHNRASSSSRAALDLRLQYKQFWVKAEGERGARCGK